MPLAQALGEGRLALAGPDVPAGRYAESALKALGVWDSVRPKVVFGENVRAAMRFVSRGEAPLGVVYDTDARVDQSVKIVGLFPAGSHPPIVYPAAATVRAGQTASAYLAYLAGPQAGAVFRKYGFRTLGR
jgi:molybdate transport system substrate-binding protein